MIRSKLKHMIKICERGFDPASDMVQTGPVKTSFNKLRIQAEGTRKCRKCLFTTVLLPQDRRLRLVMFRLPCPPNMEQCVVVVPETHFADASCVQRFSQILVECDGAVQQTNRIFMRFFLLPNHRLFQKSAGLLLLIRAAAHDHHHQATLSLLDSIGSPRKRLNTAVHKLQPRQAPTIRRASPELRHGQVVTSICMATSEPQVKRFDVIYTRQPIQPVKWLPVNSHCLIVTA